MIAKEQNARAQIIEQVYETQRNNQDKLPIADNKQIDGRQLQYTVVDDINSQWWRTTTVSGGRQVQSVVDSNYSQWWPRILYRQNIHQSSKGN